MSQFENQRCFSQDTFGLPQEHHTPISNTYTFNPGNHPTSPLILSPFTPRPRASRWDDQKLFDPSCLSPLQENLEIELEMMQREEKLAERSKAEVPFIIEQVPRRRRSNRRRKGSISTKKQDKKTKLTQTKILSYLRKNKSISK